MIPIWETKRYLSPKLIFINRTTRKSADKIVKYNQGSQKNENHITAATGWI